MLLLIVLAGFAGGVAFWVGSAKPPRFGKPRYDVRGRAAMTAGVVVLVGLLAWLVAWQSVRWQTVDREYWTGYVTEVSYTTAWTEWVTVTTTDARGNTTTTTYPVYHPEEWHVADTNGDRESISKATYLDICRRIGVASPKVKGYGGDTTRYKWDGRPETGYVWTTVHKFRNPTLAGGSLFSFRDFSRAEAKELGLPNWDDWKWRPAGTEAAFGEKLAVLNADLGRSCKVRVHFVFAADGTGSEWGEAVEEYWRKGKKNELTCVVGRTGGSVTWCRTFGWSDAEGVKAGLREHVAGMSQFDADATLAWLRAEIPNGWHVADLSEYDHVAVRVPAWLTMLFILLVSVAAYCGGRYITNVA